MQDHGEEEENTTFVAPPDISVEDFVRFADAVGISNKCDACQSSNWVVVTDVFGQTPSLVAKDFPGDIKNARTFPVLLNMCGTCGNVRTFARFYMDEWIAANPRTAQDG